MALETRRRHLPLSRGPFLAKITNHLDSTFMGRLEVALIKGISNNVLNQADTYIVNYLSPFYGVTSARFEGNDETNWQHCQKSYGMWMVPPDIGTRVLVVFIDGDPNQGYWIGCVQDTFQNHMVPGIAASKQTFMTEDQKRKYGTELLPVVEFNKKSKSLSNPNVETFQKPIHPFADRLLQQGLLLDTVRGVTSSSARREVPSGVFGISTPGPVDQGADAQQGTIGYIEDQVRTIPVSRLGGTTFVMDDGDVNGQNELVRLRTRTGHQILLHNSHDLIYIANSKGTAWIELTSGGKIDIYAADSVSIHSEQDFNFRADRDINLEAGRDINISASGHIQAEIGKYLWVTANGEISMSTKENINLLSGGETRISSQGNMSLGTASNMNQGAGGQFSAQASGQLIVNGSKVQVNSVSGNSPTSANPPKSSLSRFSLPNRSVSNGWENSSFYKADSITSIMQRVPTHEPYDQHENTDASRYAPDLTDSSIPSDSTTSVNNPQDDKIPSANTGQPPPNGKPALDWAKDIEWLKLIKSLCAKINCSPVDLLAVIYQESNCKPSSYNPNGPAYGLIQWTAAASASPRKFGYTIEKMATLSRVEQMPVMEEYFRQNNAMNLGKKGKLDISDIYSIIFCPAGIGQSSTWKAYGLPGTGAYLSTGKAYNANHTLDKENKHYITKADYTTVAARWIPLVQQNLANAGWKDDLSNLPEGSSSSTTPTSSSGRVAVVGDSIAWGTGDALKKMIPGIVVSASTGSLSITILTTWVPPVVGYDTVVVSAGSNDIAQREPKSQTTAAQNTLTKTLGQIRSALKAKKYIWILPNFSVAATVVSNFAASNGDRTVSFQASSPTAKDPYPLHPASYGPLAQSVKSML